MPRKKKIKPELIQDQETLSIPDPDVETTEAHIDLSESSGIEKEDSNESEFLKDEDLKTEIEKNLRISVNAKKTWADAAKEDIEFALGKQWSEEDQATLKDQNRPCLTFNKIKPMIQLVSGHLIQNQARIQVLPEGGEDEAFSAVMDKVLDHIDKQSNLQFKMNYQFAGAERAGRTWIEFFMDYDEDPIFGQLKTNYLGAFKVFPDPNGNEYDLSDCEFCFKIVKLSKGRLKQLYPDKKEEIDGLSEDVLDGIVTNALPTKEGDANNYGADKSKPAIGLNKTGGVDEPEGDQQQYTVVEYWKKEYVDRFFCYFIDDGSIAEYDTEEEANTEVSRRSTQYASMAADELLANKGIPTQVDQSFRVKHVLRKRRVQRMKFAVMAGNSILTDGLQDSTFEPHYHGFPFFQYIAEWNPETDDEEYRVQSLVRCLKDPQREINKSRSQYLHILNTSANSGWIGDDDALSENKWAELQQFGSTPGIVIRKKVGATLERIHPVEPSLAQNVREKAANDDLKEVSGLNADLLSVDSSASPSGRAIALRMRQAVTILQPSFMNFKLTKRLIGQFLFKIVPSMFDEIKISKILGQRFMADYKLDKMQVKAMLTQIEDGKYDIEVSEAGSMDTLRQETFEDIMTMLEKGMQIPPDVVLEFMNIPDKREVINRIQQFQNEQMQRAAAMEQMKAAPQQPPAAQPPATI